MTAINPITSSRSLLLRMQPHVQFILRLPAVILITTKQGKEGKEVITYDGSAGVYSPTRMPDLITNSAEYMGMYNQAKMNRYKPMSQICIAKPILISTKCKR